MKTINIVILVSLISLLSCRKENELTLLTEDIHSSLLKELPTEGLIALYEFTGNANDGSGNNNNGVIQGGVTLTLDRFGNENSAYQFNGIDGFISTETGGPLGISPRSVCFWVKSSSPEMQYLISYGFPQDGHCFGTALNNPCTGIGLDNSTGVAMRGNDSLINGSWHQIVIVFDAFLYGSTVSDGRFYIDGVESNVINCSAVNPQSLIDTWEGDPFIIGCDQGGGPGLNGRFLNGCLDDIRIYSRALTPDEILSLFEAPDPHPWWKKKIRNFQNSPVS